MPVKVAIIAARGDLGELGRLWLKPGAYAVYLGDELRYGYRRGVLVVVMPNGLGVYRGTEAERRSLATVKRGATADDLVQAATAGVERVAGSRGIKLVPHVSSESATWERLVIFIGGAAILVFLSVATYAKVPRRRAPASAR